MKWNSAPVISALLVFAPPLLACQLNVQHVSFGNYDPFSSANLETIGYLTVSRCPKNTSYTITASTGQGNNYNQRKMSGNGYNLSYNLYTSANHAVVFGDGSAGTTVLFGSSANASYPVYALIPAHQNIRVGQYNDSIIITLSY